MANYKTLAGNTSPPDVRGQGHFRQRAQEVRDPEPGGVPGGLRNRKLEGSDGDKRIEEEEVGEVKGRVVQGFAGPSPGSMMEAPGGPKALTGRPGWYVKNGP